MTIPESTNLSDNILVAKQIKNNHWTKIKLSQYNWMKWKDEETQHDIQNSLEDPVVTKLYHFKCSCKVKRIFPYVQ
jgi:hypothetical protein